MIGELFDFHAEAAQEIEAGEMETHHEGMPEGYYDGVEE